MKNAYDEFGDIIKIFRRGRSLKYDKKYNREHDAAQKNTHFAELYGDMEEALGEKGIQLLKNYTDCVIELYNTDADYFYDSGFDDCQQLYSKLFYIAPICRVDCDDGNEEIWLNTKSDILRQFGFDGEAETAGATTL